MNARTEMYQGRDEENVKINRSLHKEIDKTMLMCSLEKYVSLERKASVVSLNYPVPEQSKSNYHKKNI